MEETVERRAWAQRAWWRRCGCWPLQTGGTLWLLLACIAAGSNLASLAQGVPAESSAAHGDRVEPPASRAWPPAPLVSFENPSRSAIVRHEIHARLDPERGWLSASDRIFLVHPPGVPADEPAPFLLWKGLALRSLEGEFQKVRYEDRPLLDPRSFWREPRYGQLEGYEQAREVRVWPLETGVWPETLSIVLDYEGTILDSLHAPEESYARSFETTAGLIESRGAYLAGSSFWIPTRPDGVFTFLLEAEAPTGWRTVSQGRRVRWVGSGWGVWPSGHGGEESREDVWDCTQPMTEAYLVAGPWVMHERPYQDPHPLYHELRPGQYIPVPDLRDLRAQTFTYAHTDSTIYTKYLDATGRYLDLYEERIGPYPFPKFALVENFWQSGFGMPSFTLLGDRVIRLPFIVDTSYGHEILHNWWGNGVFVKTEDGNWCEGLTTYGADYYYKERESEAAARQYRLDALKGYLDYVSSGEDIPLSRFRERHDFATQAVGYSKAMMVIHQLRREVGEEKFWESLRHFYERNLWERASWRDLLASFEQVSFVQAEKFVQQWIERPGAPRILISEVELLTESGSQDGAARPGRGYSIQALLSQERVGEESEPFSMTVPVRLTWESGGDSTYQVPMDRFEHRIALQTDQRPTLLEVDPDFELMRRLHREEIPPTLSQTLGADTVTVIVASGLSPELATAYRALAQEWTREHLAEIVEESEAPAGWSPKTTAWFLGLGPSARGLVDGLSEVKMEGSGWSIAGSTYPAGNAVVLTGGLPGPPDRSWTVLAAVEPTQVPALGSKVPHYGKYSFLVFEGTTNIAKGVWSQTDSPLRVPLH